MPLSEDFEFRARLPKKEPGPFFRFKPSEGEQYKTGVILGAGTGTAGNGAIT